VASDVTGVQPSHAAQEAPARRPRAYQGRFFLIYGTLAGVLIAAVVGVALLVGTSQTARPAWSAWEPSGSTTTRTSQIAQRVSAGYRLPSGHQLVDVVAKPPAVQDLPIRAIAIQGANGAGDKVSLIDGANSLMFVLCGRGRACSIAEGKATLERGRLVRRESLELALYAFKYMGGIDHVVAFIPPRPGTQPTYVLYWNRADLKPQLDSPLGSTLGPIAPKSTAITPHERATIDRLTQPHLFQFQLQQAQQGDAILLLSPAV
jgi:hypothetical protein